MTSTAASARRAAFASAYREGDRKLIFFTHNVRVRQITTGRRPEVYYVERCA